MKEKEMCFRESISGDINTLYFGIVVFIPYAGVNLFLSVILFELVLSY